VISGSTVDINEFVESHHQQSVKLTRLDVPAAFHSPAMTTAGHSFKQYLHEVQHLFKSPHAEVVLNTADSYVVVRPGDDPKIIVDALADGSIHNPVHWSSIIEYLMNKTNLFYEVGGGHTLSGIVAKHTNSNYNTNNNSKHTCVQLTLR